MTLPESRQVGPSQNDLTCCLMSLVSTGGFPIYLVSEAHAEASTVGAESTPLLILVGEAFTAMTASWQCQGQRGLGECPRDVPSEAIRAMIIDAGLPTQDPQSQRPLCGRSH